jgi:hypothetical protein
MLSAASTEAQWAKVSGKITTEQEVPVVKSSVRVRLPNAKPDDAIRVAPAPIGNYTIEHLRTGTYDFIGCGISYRPDIHTNVEVRGDPPTLIDFVLNDPIKENALKLQLDQANTILYLKDPNSGCLVAQAISNANGDLEFTNWQPGDEVCVHNIQPKENEKPKAKGNEEYSCFQRISPP